METTQRILLDEVTVHVCAPADWTDVYVWAWKDGGEDASDAWLGMGYSFETSYFYEVLPGWIDRVTIWNAGDNTRIQDLVLDPGRNVWIAIDNQEATVHYEDPHMAVDRPVSERLFYLAAMDDNFEEMKAMLPYLEDRSFLTAWTYDDFNYAYAMDAIRAGDYETAIEFFDYCAYEDNRLYATVFQQLLDGDQEAAMDTIQSMGFTMLDLDLDMTWTEIISMATNAGKNESELDIRLQSEYLERRTDSYQPSFSLDALTFGESSAWQAEGYVGEIPDNEYYSPVTSLNELYSQCGSEANGKVLIIRSQKSYPQGTLHHAIDLSLMDYLSYDLYPASLSEVEYILEVTYDYTNAGNYQQTMTMGDNSVVDYFAFLRMKGQVQLKEVKTGNVIQKSQWIEGTGEVEAHFSDLSYQCSNMPETGADIISAVEKVRQLNGN